MKVLFVPQGLEMDRTVGAIQELRPDRVIVVRNDPQRGMELPDVERKIDELLAKVVKKVRRHMKGDTPTIDVRSHRVPFFDFYASFFAFDKWLGDQQKQRNEVFVDITGGTRLVSVALALAAMVHKARIVYVSPEKYNIPETDPQIGKGYREMKRIGALPVKVSTRSIGIEFLSALQRMGGQARSITVLAREALGHEPLHSELVSASSVIRRLEAMGLVEIARSSTRERPVRMTDAGTRFLRVSAPTRGKA